MRTSLCASALICLLAAGAHADTLTGTTIPSASISGQPNLGTHAGGIISHPSNTQTTGVNANGHDQTTQLIFGAPGTPGNDLATSGNYIFGGAFVFSIDDLSFMVSPTSPANNPAGLYNWTANIDFTAYSGPTEEQYVPMSISLDVPSTSLTTLASGWVEHSTGIATHVELHTLGGWGKISFLSKTIPSEWASLSGSSNPPAYNDTFGNSAYIMEGGAVAMTATPVPLPAAAWGGLALFGLMGAHRLRRRSA